MTSSVLGIDIQTGQRVEIPKTSRLEGTYIIGIPGTGKTGLIENLIIQDIKQGMGVGLLDPHGDLINAVLARLPDHRVKDVIYLDITDYRYPFGLNLFACSDLTNPIEVQKTVDQVMHIFDRLFEITRTTPLIIQYLRNCTHTLIANPGYTMADIPLLLRNKECRHKLIAKVRDRNVLGFWQDYEDMKASDQRAEREPILRRLEELLQPLTFNIVGQSTTTIDIRQVMNEGKILLVKLDAQLDSTTSLIGSMLIALFLNAAYSRADLPVNKRRQFNLYADEFQRFATEDFSTILVEARKYGLATTIAHQTRFQPGMTDGIRATSLSAKNLVVFKVNSKDGDEFAGEFDITPQEAWEEELEEERLEVLEKERIETIEVVDGEEPIKTYKHEVIYHLFSQNHPDPRIMHFTRNYLRPIEPLLHERPGDYLQNKGLVTEAHILMLQDWLFEGMINRNALCEEIRIECTYPFLGLHEPTISKRQSDSYPSLKKADSNFLSFYRDLLSPDENVLHPETHYNPALYKPADYSSIAHMRDGLLNIKYCSEKWRVLDERMRQEVRGNLSMSEKEYDALFAEYAQDFFISVRKAITFYDHTKAGEQPYAIIRPLHEFLKALRLCQLGLNQEPIYTMQSGHFQPRKRQQIIVHPEKTFAHPRIAITHPQRTYADVHKQVASELTNLGNFMARVRYKDANERLIESMIKTLDPKQQPNKPLFGQALQVRLASMKKQNIQDGYLRERATVEEEIRQRQEQCNQPPEEEPPISRRPPR